MCWTIFFLLLLALVVPYVVVALLARSKVILNPNPIMTNLAPDDLPEDVVAHFAKAAPALATNHFEPTAYFSVADYAPDLFTFISFWTNPQTSDVAAILVNFGASTGPLSKKQTVIHTDFYALFDNGFLIRTSNDPLPVWFKPVQTRDVVQMSDVESSAVVFRLHQNRVMRLSPAGIGKFVPPKGEEMQWYKGLLADGLKQQQAAGYIEPAAPEQPAKFRPTWMGAFMVSTVVVPPMKRIRRWQMNERAEAQMKLSRGPVRGVR
jgi:hypothetical protein